MLFDGRNKQQNGNFVVRTLLPGKKTEKLPNGLFRLKRIPVDTQTLVAYSQVGYHPLKRRWCN
jgi:hypothetical protein